MKQISLAIFLSLLLHLQINAQGDRNCSTMHNLERLEMIDPSIVHNMDAIETFTNEYIATHSMSGERLVVTIPVVVHVVYSNSTQNISDAQIASQITILNNDFRKLNADRTSIPSVFSGVAADCEINFCMAQRTPAGASSTGIDRVSTSTTSFLDDRVKSSSTGGANAWDATKYLNIWVCNLGGGLLGYAQFPGGSASTDGIVIAYTAFGNIGTAASPYNLGRTATHEVGHWLNLRHIWGDARCGSDLVTDTPTQSTSNYGCPTFPKVTCSNGPNGDMWMNYMDYTDDRCMYMFTTGQKTRAQSLFATGGSRVGLVSSDGCTPPSAGGCTTPIGLAAGSITSTSATLTWTAVSGATSYNIQYKLSAAGSWTTTTSTTNSKALTSLVASSTYNYQIQAVCSSSSSSTYSSIASFTTSAASVSCGTDLYEPNNSLATYRAISNNTNYLAYICPSGDEDWYRFTTTSSARNFRVTLTTLPFDYDLYVYNSSGTLLGSSTFGGTTSETYTRNGGTVGNYYIRVIGYAGVYSPSIRYTLKATTSSSSLRTADGSESEEEIIDIVDENTGFVVYPNPAKDHFIVSYNSEINGTAVVSIYDAMGKLLLNSPFSVSSGLNQVELNTSDLVDGYYFVVLQDGESKHSVKLLISK